MGGGKGGTEGVRVYDYVKRRERQWVAAREGRSGGKGEGGSGLWLALVLVLLAAGLVFLVGVAVP